MKEKNVDQAPGTSEARLTLHLKDVATGWQMLTQMVGNINALPQVRTKDTVLATVMLTDATNEATKTHHGICVHATVYDKEQIVSTHTQVREAMRATKTSKRQSALEHTPAKRQALMADDEDTPVRHGRDVMMNVRKLEFEEDD